MSAVVVGAGVGGLTASLALARAGHDVALVERDGFPEDGAWTSALDEARPGCAQLNQGHSFLARARLLLERNAPDVLEPLVEAGGVITDANLVLPPDHHDDELRSIAIRRALIDEVLLATVRREPRVRLEGTAVSGLVARANGGVPVVTGVRLADGRALDADVVIDASGRRSSLPGMLTDIGARPPDERSSPCGLVYYGRYVEVREGATPPPYFAPVLVRNTLGYVHYALFVQGPRLLLLAISPEAADREMRALRSDAAFMAAWRSIRHVAPFADEGFAVPVSGVVVFGGLQNVRRSYVADGRPVAKRLVVIGDGLCHTDPTPAYGMSMAMEAAFRLPALIEQDPDDAMARLEEQIGAELDERYEHVTRANTERMAFANGKPRDLDADVEFVAETGALTLARTEPDALRRYMRRVLALDLPSVLTDDTDFMDAARAALVSSGLLDKQRRPAREEMLRAMVPAS